MSHIDELCDLMSIHNIDDKYVDIIPPDIVSSVKEQINIMINYFENEYGSTTDGNDMFISSVLQEIDSICNNYAFTTSTNIYKNYTNTDIDRYTIELSFYDLARQEKNKFINYIMSF